MTNHRGPIVAACRRSPCSSSAIEATLTAIAPMLSACAEIDLGHHLVIGVLQQVVEVGAAGGHLQPVDAAIAAIVEQHDGELQAEHHRGRELGIHHHVGAVADHDDDIRHRDAPSSRRGRRQSRSPCRRSRIPCGSCPARGRPQLVQFARQAAGRAERTYFRRRSRATAPITCASEGRAALVAAIALRGASNQIFFSFSPCRSRASGAFQPSKPLEIAFKPSGIGDHGCALCLTASKRRVDADDRQLGILEQRPRAGGEILQRVPTARITSASSASALAADVPVTPTEPERQRMPSRRSPTCRPG
jgi:hypothetical protein